jgi:hypothetical protein
MCYSHVVNYWKKSLRNHPVATQKLICDEIYNLHCSVSQQEFEGRYREVSARWRNEVPKCARYFNTQWFLGNFSDWHKCYELRHLLSLEVKQKSEEIDKWNYVIREERNAVVTYQKHGYNETYLVRCLNGTCTCRCYMKMGYCKHLLHTHVWLNEDSDFVIIDCRFKYIGNTKLTKRQRGRVRDALPALQVM